MMMTVDFPPTPLCMVKCIKTIIEDGVELFTAGKEYPVAGFRPGHLYIRLENSSEYSDYPSYIGVLCSEYEEIFAVE